jgi:ferredoxin
VIKMLTEKLKNFAVENGADLVGITNVEAMAGSITQPHRPQDLLPEVESVVVMALHIPDGVLEAQRRGITSYSYNMFGYNYLNKELDYVAYRVTRFLESNGYQGLPIPGRGNHYWEKKKFHGPFSFRHAAVAAGIGVFGWHGMLITPEFGPRQRIIAVLTDAPLTPDRPLDANLCDKCYECVKNCPAGAIKKKLWTCEMGGRTYEYGEVDGDRCWWVAKALTTKAWPGAPFNAEINVESSLASSPEGKFKALWEERDPRIRLNEHDEGNYGATHCGRCLIFCTAGIKAMEKRKTLRRSEHNV